jgi:RimJ/RimL family protein N-acetyltransferase
MIPPMIAPSIPVDRISITRRCILRHPQVADAARLLAALTHPSFPPELPFAQLRTVEAVEGALLRRQERWQTGTGFNWCVDERDGGSLVGMVGLARGSHVQTWELSFLIEPSKWRQGFATEAALEALRIAFDELGAAKVEAGAAVWNAGSQAVLARLGFVFLNENPQGYSIRGRPVRTREYELRVEAWRTRTGAGSANDER